MPGDRQDQRSRSDLPDLRTTIGVRRTAISRLNDNERQTLLSYFSYVFTPYAQDRLAQNKYAKLPDALLSKLRAGFQRYF
jgi:hypothetical protein